MFLTKHGPGNYPPQSTQIWYKKRNQIQPRILWDEIFVLFIQNSIQDAFFYRMHARLWFSISVLWYKDERDFVTSFSKRSHHRLNVLFQIRTQRQACERHFLQHFKYQLHYRSQLIPDITNISYTKRCEKSYKYIATWIFLFSLWFLKWKFIKDFCSCEFGWILLK